MRQFAFIAPFLFAATITSFARAADEKPDPRTVTTSGEAVVYVVPDEVVVGFGVETFHSDLDASKTANENASKKLLAAVKAVGIEEKRIQTDALSLEVRYREGRPASGIEGYISRRSYSVTIKDVKKLQAVVDAALKNGGNQLMGVEYRTTELRKHRDKARKMAIKAAKEKAQALSEELECKIGSPRTISEGYMGWGYAGGSWGRYGANAMSQNNFQQEAPAAGGGEGDEASPLGQIGVRAQVIVVFDLIPEAGAGAGAKPEATK